MNSSAARKWTTPATALLGWAGLFVHNVGELPGHGIVGWELLLPLMLTLVFVIGWFTRVQRLAAIGMLSLGVLNVIGSMSVLPLPFLPFSPEQTLGHYLFHGVYLSAQLPLIFTTLAWIRSHPRKNSYAEKRGAHSSNQ